jgi:hypothetical protein
VKVAGVFLLFFLPVVVIACNGCGATGISPQTGIAIGEDLGQVTCTILEGIPQTDVTAVQLICSQLPKHGTKGTVKTFRMTVTKAQADALTAPAPGKVSP